MSDPAQSAKAASLRDVVDSRAGFQRKRAGTGFSYIGLDQRPIRDRETLRRIRSLAIPPAWTDVWICPLADGHLQATGRDARGRKQYRYHARWREVRDETKYGRMIPFGSALPRIRAQLQEDLALHDLPRNKVLATIVRLLETTFIRVGNEEYARTNRSFGLTTMKTRHVEVEGSSIHFTFRGKGGKAHEISVSDRYLARLVKRCRDLPGQDLFQYIDEAGERQRVTSADVNEYLRNISAQDFTAKDFRTWAGTLLAATELTTSGCAETATEAKSVIARAVESVSGRLGNTPAICRKCYIHPMVLEAYQDADLFARWTRALERAGDEEGLTREEGALLRFLSEDK
ncbi:MAG TPA: DNA topoisomerase IB [Gemmatimonadales bacterium]